MADKIDIPTTLYSHHPDKPAIRFVPTESDAIGHWSCDTPVERANGQQA